LKGLLYSERVHLDELISLTGSYFFSGLDKIINSLTSFNDYLNHRR